MNKIEHTIRYIIISLMLVSIRSYADNLHNYKIVCQGIEYLSRQDILDNKTYPWSPSMGIKDLIYKLDSDLKYTCRDRKKKIEKYLSAALARKNLTMQTLHGN